MRILISLDDYDISQRLKLIHDRAYNHCMGFTYASLPWLLEEDGTGIRFPVLKHLVNVSIDDQQLRTAKQYAYSQGLIGQVLHQMEPEGYWSKPGGGYSPKYFSTVWSLILLSQLGASAADDKRIATACSYYLDHALSSEGSLSYNGKPAGTIDCLQGNMCSALTELGYEDERLNQTYEWMASSVIGKDVDYHAYKCGPNFSCGANGKKPCAWGAVKVLLALGKISPQKRTELINQAIQTGISFLFSVDPVTADYPTAANTKPNRTWWEFGFPVFYNTDILQLAEVLVALGYGQDPRLQSTINLILSKQDTGGRWSLDHHYHGKTWANFGKKGQPNKWVTYRVLKLLKMLQPTKI